VSACETAVTTTVEGFGNADGAVYRPPVVIVPTVGFPPGTPATSQFTIVFVVPVTVAVNGTVCPTTTDVAEGNTLTVMPVEFPLVLEDGLLLQPAFHKIARVRNSFPVRPIIIPRMFKG
jgi:hypothetical protein